jgi:pimeloyl-ACP methyl ester carboxylesterase
MLFTRLRVLYLHGFASSPESRKARFFTEELRSLSFAVEVPDLAEGDFENLTIRGQLELLERVAGNEPVILIGSSLGGYVASLYAARHQEVTRLILLAPAFGFYGLWKTELGEERMAAWKRDGTLPVYHYALGRETPLRYAFIEDAARFEPSPDFTQPALIFHGNQDTVVPVQQSVVFAADHPNVRLIRVDSGHELTDVLDMIWTTSRPFLLDAASRFD